MKQKCSTYSYGHNTRKEKGKLYHMTNVSHFTYIPTDKQTYNHCNVM